MSSENAIPFIAPPLNPALPPRFYEMGEYHFQDFCRELWLQEKGIAECHHYGVRGQAQFGVDLLAYGQPNEPNRAGQCKCYKKITSAHVRSAVSKFLEHISHWSEKGVTDFTLFVACPADDQKVVEEMDLQRRKLAKFQIRFHLWDAGILRNKLRPHPAIVGNYCTEAWVPFICGGGPTGVAAVGASVMMQVVGTVVDDLSSARHELLDDIRERLRCGEKLDSLRRLQELRSSPSWPHLSGNVKGKALRLMASAVIASRRDLQSAVACVEEARKIEPEGNFQVIDAWLAYFCHGVQAALAKLGDPSTIEGFNLQIELLLAEERAADVILITDSPKFAANSDTHRIRALALLIEKRVDEALSEIAKSAALTPNWILVRLAEATIRYSSCLCPWFSGWKHLNWPVPPDLRLVKRDTASLENLRIAAEMFDRLLAEEPSGTLEHATLQTWKLACLANKDGQQAAAATFARQVLDINPGNFRVVVWSLERGYSFEFDRISIALQEIASAPQPPIDAVLALANLHALKGDLTAAETILNEKKEYFSEPSIRAVWQFMMVQFAGARNAGDEAQALLINVSEANLQRRGKAILLRQMALRTHEFKPLADFLEDSYQTSLDPLELLECCEAKIEAHDPKFVADQAENLLSKLPTPRALQVALIGASQSGRAEMGLALLESYATILGDGRLPGPFCRMRIDLLGQSGRLPDAADEAEHLASSETNAGNLLTQFTAQFALGDLDGCTGTAHLISRHTDITPFQRLQVARQIAGHNSRLAITLWEQAMSRNPTAPETIMLAVNLGFRLGLDDRIGPLLACLPALAAGGQAGVKMIGIEEILQHMGDYQKRLGEVNELYDLGTLPMHLCAVQARHPLAAVYHSQLEQNEKAETLLGRASLLARHGAKTVDKELTIHPGKIYADITAILLAEHFDLLGLIEGELGPIRISAQLPESLISQLDQIENSQPSLQPGKTTLIDLAAQNKIKGVIAPSLMVQRQDDVGKKMGQHWCTWLERMRSMKGYLVDHWPLRSNDTSMTFVALSEEDYQIVIGVNELLLALVNLGVITPEDQKASTSVFGIEAVTAGRSIDLELGTSIFLKSGVAEQLARTNILSALCKGFRVEIEDSELLRIRAELQAEEHKRRLALWLRHLLDRIQKGLRGGTYVPFASNLPRPDDASYLACDEFNVFGNILDAEAASGGVVWCDDRFVNGFKNSAAGPLVGISEVLLALRRRGTLDDAAYHAVILRLRASNIRHLPVTSEEILHHLRRAPFRQGDVIETPALSVIRRTLATSLLDVHGLQKPQPEEVSTGYLAELTWIHSLQTSVMEGIAALWQTDSVSDAEARANWLLEFVYFDPRLYFEVIFENAQADPSLSIALTIAQLIVAGFKLKSEWHIRLKSASSPRASYFRWLEKAIFAQHIGINPQIFPLVGEALTREMADFINQGFDSDERRRAACLFLYGVYIELPKALHPFCCLPKEVLAELKAVDGITVVYAFGRTFDHVSWWRSAATAYNGQVSEVKDSDGQEFFLKPDKLEAATETLLASGPTHEGDVRVRERLLGLLADSVSGRRSFLQMRPELFDCSCKQREEAIELIVHITEPDERILAAEEWGDRSTEWFYRELASRLRQGTSMTIADFFPAKVEGLRSHLRLVIADEPQWDETAQQLISDEGGLPALMRLASLPVNLPSSIISLVRELSNDDRKRLLEQAGKELLTPLSQLHLAHLLGACADLNHAYLEQANLVLKDLVYGEGTKHWRAFHAILNWTFLRLRQLAGTNSWSVAERLSLTWVHATRIHNELLKIQANSADIESRFNLTHAFLAQNPIMPEASLYDDACAPHRVTWMNLLASAFGAILRQLPPEIGEALRPVDAQWLGEDDVAKGHTLLDIGLANSMRPDALRSWLGEQKAAALVALFGQEFVNNLLAFGLESASEAALCDLEQNTANTDAWRLLCNTTFERPLSTGLIERLMKLLRSYKPADYFPSLLEKCGLVLIIGGAVARFSGDEQFINEVAEDLVTVAAKAKTSKDFNGDANGEKARCETLIQSLIYASQNLYVSDHIETTAQRTYKLLAQLVRTWPIMGTVMRRRLGAQIPMTQFSEGKGAWSFFLALRAAP